MQEGPVRESVVPEPVVREPPLSATPALPLAVLRERRAEALFARANAERAARRNDEALADYAQLERAFPRTRNALASRISRADLLRRMDQPQQALEVYQGYLGAQPDGALAEEARAGIAVSYQRLGREEQERAAWQELLDHHSGSLHARRARARLQALSR
jgi:tetratricopeptide (TPR) repeat protein